MVNLKIVAVLLLSFLYLVSSNPNQICFNLAPDSPAFLSTGIGQMGRPGKQGPRGVKGEKGSTGECSCDGSEIAKLIQSVELLQSQVNQFLHSHNDRITHCGVGMKDGRIPGSSITASVILAGRFDPHVHHPSHGRLDNQPRNGHIGAWATGNNSPGQWLQVDLSKPTLLKGIVTQGRPTGPQQWITSYKIAYGNTTNNMNMIQQNGSDVIFEGNVDMGSYRFNDFPEPIFTRFVRLVIHTINGWATARIEFLTC